LLRKNEEFSWNQECQGSFNNLKEFLIQDPILKYPDFSKEFIIRTDASYEVLGGLLLQKNDGKEFPIH